MKRVHSPKEPAVGSEFHTCDVHKWAGGDAAPRLCRYCNACRAWICSECWHSPKRIMAFVNRTFGHEPRQVAHG